MTLLPALLRLGVVFYFIDSQQDLADASCMISLDVQCFSFPN